MPQFWPEPPWEQVIVAYCCDVHLSIFKYLSVVSSDFQEALEDCCSWVVSHVEGSGEVSHSGEQVRAQDALRESQDQEGSVPTDKSGEITKEIAKQISHQITNGKESYVQARQTKTNLLRLLR